MLLSSLLLASQLWASPNLSLFQDGSHCVAYRARKTMFLVSSGEVIGRNCDISAQVLPEVGGLYHIEVNIPVKSFQSGDADRDEDVMKTLKASDRAELVFKSKPMTAEEWRKLFAKEKFQIAGELSIGKKTYPIKLDSHYLQTEDSGAEVEGMAKVSFKDFDIDPPRVAGGLIAKTKQDLELHFHLLSSRILGADSIRLENKTAEKEKKEEQ